MFLKTSQSQFPKTITKVKVHTGLQSQFSFWPCTTWLEAVYFLHISLSNRLFSPGMRRNSANILWTCGEKQRGQWRIKLHSSCTQYSSKRSMFLDPSKYLVPLSAHEKHTQHVKHLHFVHDLMNDFHGLGQSVSERAGGQGALIWWLWMETKVRSQSQSNIIQFLK